MVPDILPDPVSIEPIETTATVENHFDDDIMMIGDHNADGGNSEEDEDDDIEDSEDEIWMYQGGRHARIRPTTIQERFVERMMEEMDKDDETRLWNNAQGRVHIKGLFEMLFDNASTVRTAADQRILSYYRLQALIDDPHILPILQ